MLVRLSEIQVKLYEKYLELNSLTEEGDLKGVSLFSDYQTLMRVWTHPWVLKLEALRQEKKVTSCQGGFRGESWWFPSYNP